MKKHMNILMGGALIALLSSLPAMAGVVSSEIGSVLKVQGKTVATSADGTARTLKLADAIFLNDRVVTGKGAKIQIKFIDGSVIGQGELGDMVIDEYLYNPKVKKENAFKARMFKGVFRVVTDHITKLNPDRFRIQAKHGTIGIRGCDVAVRISGAEDLILVNALHHADSVVVGVSPDLRAAAGAVKVPIVVKKGGTLIAVSALKGLEPRKLTANILNQFKADTLPAVENGDGNGGADGGQAPAPKAETSDNSGAGAVDISTFAQTVAASDISDKVDTPAPAAPVVAPVVAAPASAPVTEEVTVNAAPAGPQSGVTVKPVVTTNRGGGADWSWGVWEQETVSVENGAATSTFAAGAFVNGNVISPTDFDAITAGPALSLSGTGIAAAGINEGGNTVLVEGSSNLGVMVGGGNAPVWNGTFSMSGGGASLSFGASGSIAGGALSGSLDSYSLNTSTGGKGMPGSQSINGNLVGPGSANPAAPISGAIGTFQFGHGGTSVDGVFGADLR